MKKCTKCGIEKELSYFYKCKGGKFGVQSICKECIQKYQVNNREQQKEYNKNYQLTNKDKIKEDKKEYYLENKNKINNYYLQSKYGITLDQYNEMLKKQNNLCIICGKEETTIIRGKLLNLAIDHNHKTGKVRGLLCINCNHLLGNAKDNKQVLLNAINYLTKE